MFEWPEEPLHIVDVVQWIVAVREFVHGRAVRYAIVEYAQEGGPRSNGGDGHANICW